jgi:FixJ family two-component response regulator
MSKGLLVAIVDDSESVRESLPDLLQDMGYAALVFASAEEFLASGCAERADCLLLDIAMPGMSGPELYRLLGNAGKILPVIYITASHDETVRAQLLSRGAVDCLLKPFTDLALKKALDAAFGPDTSRAP